MKRVIYLFLFCSITFITFSSSLASQEIISIHVKEAPILDGFINDSAWSTAAPSTIQDVRLNVPVMMKSVHTDSIVYFLVVYPDPTEDILHKPWVWSKELSSYTLGPQREDTFVFRWNMEAQEVYLSSLSDDDFTSDLWYWKANRTNPAGYADDKIDILSSQKQKRTAHIISKTGKTRYLLRQADHGTECYQQVVPIDFQDDIMSQFRTAEPVGSRGDIRAKGVWQEGYWRIEFAREIDTNNADDIIFDIKSGRRYLFGISIKSLYGEPIDDTLSNSNLYGQGRISEPLYLFFQ